MANVSNTGDQATKWMRWIAHGIGALVAAFWLFMGITYDVVGSRPWTLKGLAMLVSGGPFLLVGLLFLAYWWRSRMNV